MGSVRAVKHVGQRDEADCGVAVIAMLARQSYIRAAEALNPDDPDCPIAGMSCPVLVAALGELTGQRWRFRRLGYPRPSLADAAWPDAVCGAVVRPAGEREGHFVVWDPDRGEILDPALSGPRKFAGYLRRPDREGWQVIGWIVPA